MSERKTNYRINGELMKDIGRVTKLLNEDVIEVAFGRLADVARALLKEKMELEEAGMFEGGSTMKDGKYFVLIHPVDEHGKQKREYVGSDPAAIESARERQARYRRWCRVVDELERVHYRVRRVNGQIDFLLSECGAVKQLEMGDGAG